MNYPCSYCHHDTRDQPRVILTMKFVPFVFGNYGVNELHFIKHVRKPNDLARIDEIENEHISKK